MTSEQPRTCPFQTIGLVGLGQIGGSIAQATLAGQGPDRQPSRVVGFDCCARSREAAARQGVDVLASVAQVFEQSDLVVLAVPLNRYTEVLQRARRSSDGRLPGCGTLVDVGSASAPFAEALRHGSDIAPWRAIGTHPMAGTEKTGWAAAQPDLFAGRPWVIQYQHAVGATDHLAVVQWILGLGAHALLLAPEQHDRVVARISHLPHLLALTLLDLAYAGADGALARSLAAGSMRDATRVAASDPQLASAMCSANADALSAALAQVIEQLKASQRCLDARDDAGLLQRFRRSHDLKVVPSAGNAPDRVIRAPHAQALIDLLVAASAAGEAITHLDADAHLSAHVGYRPGLDTHAPPRAVSSPP